MLNLFSRALPGLSLIFKEMEAKQEIPERLRADLKAVEGRYKPNRGEEEPNSRRVLDDHSVERAMFNEIMGGAFKAGVGSGINDVLSSSSSSSASSSNKFDDCLLDRLTLCEKEGQALRRHLAEASERATKLEKENKDLRKALDAFESGEVQETIMSLQEDNMDLYNQIEEMEKFLKDYGLVWVGHAGADKRNGRVDDPAENMAASESKDDGTDHDVAVHVLVKKIKELNEMLENEQAEVRIFDNGNGKTHRKAKFMRADEYCDTIPVRIFKDGILIKRGPFRKCGSEGYQKFVRDVVDGYFPSEFRNEHPDGLIMAVTDLSKEPWDESKLDTLDNRTLVNRLPKTILKDGEVVKVRGDVEELLAGKGDPRAVAAPKREQVVVEGSSRRDRENKENKGCDDPDVTVQVRWLDGTKALVLKMSGSDIIGDCREEIKRHFGGLECPPFKLRSAFPPRNLDDYMSLEEAGLTPRGIIVACKVV